jgi:hypothetical protein
MRRLILATTLRRHRRTIGHPRTFTTRKVKLTIPRAPSLVNTNFPDTDVNHPLTFNGTVMKYSVSPLSTATSTFSSIKLRASIANLTYVRRPRARVSTTVRPRTAGASGTRPFRTSTT